jgi:ABC-type dipeptide/oligopeptide/nickel transport system permease subunit
MSTASFAARKLPRRYRYGLPLPASMRRPLAICGIIVVVGWIAIAVFAPLIAPYGPLATTSHMLAPPSLAHPMGTDELGRDVLSRVIYGARVTLPLALILVASAVVVGGAMGAIAGYFGGWVDGVIMRITDLVFAFPAIVLAMVITAVLGPSLSNAVLAMVVVYWPIFARVVRGLVLSAAEAEYVQTSRLLGASASRALLRDVLPNVVGPVAVLATLYISDAILTLSGLSFLGLGAQPPKAEWGLMVSDGTQYFQQWWVGVFPGLAIFTVALAFNFLGDSLRDALDPRGQAQREVPTKG